MPPDGTAPGIQRPPLTILDLLGTQGWILRLTPLSPRQEFSSAAGWLEGPLDTVPVPTSNYLWNAEPL